MQVDRVAWDTGVSAEQQQNDIISRKAPVIVTGAIDRCMCTTASLTQLMVPAACRCLALRAQTSHRLRLCRVLQVAYQTVDH